MKRLLRNVFVLTRRQKKIIVLVFLLSIYRNLLLLVGSKRAFAEQISNNSVSKDNLTAEKIAIAKEITQAIAIGNKYIFWKNVCRHQSWQAIYLLNKYQIPFQYFVGVQKVQNIREGHSWVLVNDKFICGKCKIRNYIILHQKNTQILKKLTVK